jgi:ABC-2 type transport system permease protein
MLFLPVPILLAVMFTLGVSFMLSAIAVFFNDIISMYQVVLMPWMYLTPIVYPIEIVPKKFVPFLKLNPMYYIVECFRSPIFAGTLPAPEVFGIGLALALSTLLLGYLVFIKLSDNFVFYV